MERPRRPRTNPRILRDRPSWNGLGNTIDAWTNKTITTLATVAVAIEGGANPWNGAARQGAAVAASNGRTVVATTTTITRRRTPTRRSVAAVAVGVRPSAVNRRDEPRQRRIPS